MSDDVAAQVATLLTQSRAAHVAYQHAARERRTIDLTRALSLRMDADALDPEHVSPAWRDEPAKYNHAALVTFYAEQLARG